MKKRSGKLIVAATLAILSLAQIACAQNLASEVKKAIEDFRFNNETEKNISRVSDNAAKFNEFKLSLGSQMLSYQEQSHVAPSDAKHIETGYKGLNLEGLNDSEIKFSSEDSRSFGSVITLNNSYQENTIGFNDGSVNTLALAGRAGRLSIRSEYSQTNKPLAVSERSSNSSILASSRASLNGNTNNASAKEVEAAIASDYYLEAVYSFKPTLKGKVAFKRSMIDTFESKENVTVEGIMETGSNTAIKAGYSNENLIEVETDKAKEEKVWTEFILKF